MYVSVFTVTLGYQSSSYVGSQDLKPCHFKHLKIVSITIGWENINSFILVCLFCVKFLTRMFGLMRYNPGSRIYSLIDHQAGISLNFEQW